MTAVGESFQNGETCKGEVIAQNGRYEIDKIEIDGTYPEASELGEAWTRNQESRVRVKVSEGAGTIAIRSALQPVGGSVRMELYDLVAPGETHDGMQSVIIPPNTWYAWQSRGDEPLQVLATFEPPFDPDKYDVKTEQEIITQTQGKA